MIKRAKEEVCGDKSRVKTVQPWTCPVGDFPGGRKASAMLINIRARCYISYATMIFAVL